MRSVGSEKLKLLRRAPCLSGGRLITQTLLKVRRKYAQDLYPAVKAFYDLHFPDEEWRAHFAAFDLGNDLTLSTRLQSLRALARNEGQDGDKAVRAFTHVFPRARQM